MRFYKQPHAFYAGIDLHARSMFTHILDHAGAIGIVPQAEVNQLAADLAPTAGIMRGARIAGVGLDGLARFGGLASRGGCGRIALHGDNPVCVVIVSASIENERLCTRSSTG